MDTLQIILNSSITIFGIMATSFLTWLKIRNNLDVISSKINNLTFKVDRLDEDNDKRNFKDALSAKIHSEAHKIINDKLANNDELKNLIKIVCKTGYSDVVAVILKGNFKETDCDVKSLLISTARTVRDNINYKKLFLTKYESIDNDTNLDENTKSYKKRKIAKDFYKDIKINVIEPVIENFIIDYNKVVYLENGVRRKEFENIILPMIRTLIGNTIEKFNKYN